MGKRLEANVVEQARLKVWLDRNRETRRLTREAILLIYDLAREVERNAKLISIVPRARELTLDLEKMRRTYFAPSLANVLKEVVETLDDLAASELEEIQRFEIGALAKASDDTLARTARAVAEGMRRGTRGNLAVTNAVRLKLLEDAELVAFRIEAGELSDDPDANLYPETISWKEDFPEIWKALVDLEIEELRGANEEEKREEKEAEARRAKAEEEEALPVVDRDPETTA